MAAKKNEKSAGETMLTKIYNHARRVKDDKAGLSTEVLANAADISVKDAYSRAWWLQNKEGLLVSTGKGKEKVWRLSAKGRKLLSPPAAAEA